MTSHHGNNSNNNNNDQHYSFHAFFQGWLARQQAFLDELIAISTNNTNMPNDYDENGQHYDHATIIVNKNHLIGQVLDHYKEYYAEKGKLLKQDPFCIISPYWLTSFEKTLLWIGGFKPSLAFKLAETSVSDMVSEQVDQMNRLKSQTLDEEKDLMDVFSSMQDSVGFLPLKDKLRQEGGDMLESSNDESMNHLKDLMAAIVFKANDLRESTAMELMQILNEDQIIQFLVAVAKCQLRVRAWGRKMDNLNS